MFKSSCCNCSTVCAFNQVAGILGMSDFNTDDMTRKLEEILPVIRQVNEQFRNPVRISDDQNNCLNCFMANNHFVVVCIVFCLSSSITFFCSLYNLFLWYSFWPLYLICSESASILVMSPIALLPFHINLSIQFLFISLSLCPFNSCVLSQPLQKLQLNIQLCFCVEVYAVAELLSIIPIVFNIIGQFLYKNFKFFMKRLWICHKNKNF